MAICVMNLSNKFLTDDSLPLLLNSAPEPSIILIEDVDHAFNDFSRITFSGLLNAIDGVAAQEGRILFLTTNHIEKLDPALIRPGRVDVQEEITFATPKQMEDMYSRFFPNNQELSLIFAQSVPNCTVSMAKLQGYLFSRRDNPQAALSDIGLLMQSTAQELIHGSEYAMRGVSKTYTMPSVIPKKAVA
jgi:chaperone BCS1